jgi:hypothetical protein
MISSDTAAKMNSVLEMGVFYGMRPKREWRKIRRQMRRLNRAIEHEDDQAARAAVEALAEHGRGIQLACGPTLGHGGGIGQNAVAPPPEAVALKNKIIGSL